MGLDDGVIDIWAKQAMEDMGQKKWRDLDPNSMMLIIYSIEKTREKRLVSKITKPIWWLLVTIGAGVIYFIINSLFL